MHHKFQLLMKQFDQNFILIELSIIISYYSDNNLNSCLVFVNKLLSDFL